MFTEKDEKEFDKEFDEQIAEVLEYRRDRWGRVKLNLFGSVVNLLVLIHFYNHGRTFFALSIALCFTLTMLLFVGSMVDYVRLTRVHKGMLTERQFMKEMMRRERQHQTVDQ